MSRTLPYPDPLEDALAHPAHLNDGGFTAQVVDALPRRSRARALILATGGFASAGAAGLVLAGPLLPLVETMSSGRMVPSVSALAATLFALMAPLATAVIALRAEGPLGDA
jgi:hypothetical protein